MEATQSTLNHVIDLVHRTQIRNARSSKLQKRELERNMLTRTTRKPQVTKYEFWRRRGSERKSARRWRHRRAECSRQLLQRGTILLLRQNLRRMQALRSAPLCQSDPQTCAECRC